MENTNVLFDRKRLVRLIVPLIVEQVLAVTVGMADMVMVSGAGETAVSGISLVNTICVLLIVIFTSMASGGSVVGAQFLGSGDKKTACHAAEQLVMICGLIALVICGISFFGNRWILRVVYGSVEEQVMAYAVEYFFITSLSFPFLGIYNAGAALFRVMGNSNISMVTSIVMNALNIIGNAVFVFGFDMKVIANSRHKKTGPQYDGIEQVSMEEIFERSDVISIHCPHTKETENLLNRKIPEKAAPYLPAPGQIPQKLRPEVRSHPPEFSLHLHRSVSLSQVHQSEPSELLPWPFPFLYLRKVLLLSLPGHKRL